MIEAQSVMNKNVLLLPFDLSVPEAIEQFRRTGVSLALIQADDFRYNGVLTEANLVRMYLKYQSQPVKDSMILYRECFEPIQLVHAKEHFPDVVKKIMTSVGNRVFVINDEGKVIGIITAKDMLPYFSSSTGNDKPDEKSLSELYLYENFFEKSPFMMHSVSADGQIQMANEMLHAALEYPYGALVGKTVFEIYPVENHDKVAAGVKTILSKGFNHVLNAEMLKSDGHVLPVEMSSRALLDQNQKPVGTITVSRPLEMRSHLKSLNLLSN